MKLLSTVLGVIFSLSATASTPVHTCLLEYRLDGIESSTTFKIREGLQGMYKTKNSPLYALVNTSKTAPSKINVEVSLVNIENGVITPIDDIIGKTNVNLTIKNNTFDFYKVGYYDNYLLWACNWPAQ